MKREGMHHAKLKLLARDLGESLNYVRGLLVTLWSATAISFPRGDIGRLTNEEIAVTAEHEGDANVLVDALVKRRLLDEIPAEDGRLYVHDWHEHADDFVQQRVARDAGTFANGVPSRRCKLSDNDGRKAASVKTPRQRPTVSDNDRQRPPLSDSRDRALPVPVPVSVPLPVSVPVSVPVPKSPTAPDSFCPETDKPSSGPEPAPSEFTFDIDGATPGERSWTLAKAKLDEYIAAYQTLDVRGEMVKARQWCRDNPRRRKTARGMHAFLANWLNDAVSRNSRSPPRDQRRGGGGGSVIDWGLADDAR